MKELIEKEIKGCFDYFYYETNWDINSKGYGLVLDKINSSTASIAATGFGLCALIIGCKRNYISYAEAEEKVYYSLKSIYENVPHYKGFMAHFLNIEDGSRKAYTEYSTIDTAIFLMSCIACGSFFKNRVENLANNFLERTDFDYLIYEQNKEKFFHMSIEEDRLTKELKFGPGKWDYFAEQIMMYILYAAKENTEAKVAQELYYSFKRPMGSYKGENFIYCFNNSLFIHQFTQCFFDFSKYTDSLGYNWFLNSKNATLANRRYCMDQKWSKTYNKDSWGLTACMTKDGYRVFGSKPNGHAFYKCDVKVDGTVSSYAALCSMPFTPKYSLDHLKYAYGIDGLIGKYGIYDSYNFETEHYICKTYLGIDKGPTIIMLDNYENGTIWKLFMQSKAAKRAIEKLDFKKIFTRL